MAVNSTFGCVLSHPSLLHLSLRLVNGNEKFSFFVSSVCQQRYWHDLLMCGTIDL